jgi:large subunit ribosomal protein L30
MAGKDAKETAKEAGNLYAAVMLKGTVKTTSKACDTLAKLRLSGPNSCVIVPADDTRKGMLKRVDEYVTWGEIEEGTLAKLLEKRGGLDAKKAKELSSKALKKGLPESGTFRLSPPIGGLRSVRLHRPRGDTGYRGAEINKLLERMI